MSFRRLRTRLYKIDKRSIEKLKSILLDVVLSNEDDSDNDDIINANEEDVVIKRLLCFIDAAEVILSRNDVFEISLRELSEVMRMTLTENF